MDEAQIVDWYDIVEAVANGRLTGHRCPVCEEGTLNASVEMGRVRVACPECNEGFEGRLGGARDDGFYAEADALLRRQSGEAAPPAEPSPKAEEIEALRAQIDAAQEALVALSAQVQALQGVTTEVEAAVEATAAQAPAAEEASWAWSISPDQPGDRDYVDWFDIVQAIHNGHMTGHRCPFCSEPLDTIQRADPYIRVYCTVCGEGFEGKLA